MSSEYAIEVISLTKEFILYKNPRKILTSYLFNKAEGCTKHVVLNSIDLKIKKNETFALIGENGTGKSTLLRILCGLLQPTSGEVRVKGRVSPLLELGTAFDPDFSGLDNIFLNASLLGYKSSTIKDKLDQIIDFADIGDFINLPVRTYSSGMYARLAFAVAINVDPEILIVDEILSVGDAAFRRKCFERINRIKEMGSTIIFVSHSSSQVLELADRAAIIDKGEIIQVGDPKDCINNYSSILFSPKDKKIHIREQIKKEYKDNYNRKETGKVLTNISQINRNKKEEEEFYDPELEDICPQYYESHGAEIFNIEIKSVNGDDKINVLRPNRNYRICFKVRFTKSLYNVRFATLIKSPLGTELGGMVSHSHMDGISLVPEETVYNVAFTFKSMLNDGIYYINAGVWCSADDEYIFAHRVIDGYIFRILNNNALLKTKHIDFFGDNICEFNAI